MILHSHLGHVTGARCLLAEVDFCTVILYRTRPTLRRTGKRLYLHQPCGRPQWISTAAAKLSLAHCKKHHLQVRSGTHLCDLQHLHILPSRKDESLNLWKSSEPTTCQSDAFVPETRVLRCGFHDAPLRIVSQIAASRVVARYVSHRTMSLDAPGHSPFALTFFILLYVALG